MTTATIAYISIVSLVILAYLILGMIFKSEQKHADRAMAVKLARYAPADSFPRLIGGEK